MYNDGGITDNLWTGSYDAVEGMYDYPSAHQNLIVRFPTWYLSADDGDFTTDSATITSEVCASEDITIGNAPAQIFSATMLNPSGLMENCTWSDGTVYLGVVTAEASADTHSGWVACVSFNAHEYGFTANGTAYYDSTSQAIGGDPKAIVVKQDGTAEYYTSTGAYKYDGGFTSITPDAFVAAKYANYDEPLGIILDANNCPSIINNVATGTKTTTTYIPMGIFDFSNVDAFGITFNVEAYDGMVKFDADATAWVEALDFTTPLTLSDLITAISTQVGFTPIVSGYAVNTSLSFSENPITNYASTYRQVLKWLAEAIGCNVRISRTGQLVFWVFGSSVATITPDTIISNTRTKNRYTIPQMTRVVCYNTVGAGYEDGVSGPPYYIIANPFVDPSAGMTPVTNLLSIVGNIPTYYPTTISVACADPRIDAGDLITVTATDGTSYVVPIMRQTLAWNGTCKATYIATGNQTRAIPEAMTGSDLSSVANSNPTAIVNKIAAHGIDADWITAGTISDRNNRNSWDLDSGDLTITTGKIQTTYTKTYYYADYDASDISRITQILYQQVTPTDADYEKYDIEGTGEIKPATRTRIQQIIDTQTNLVKTVTTIIDPSAYEYAIKITTDVPAVGTAQAFNYSTLYSGPKIKAYTFDGSVFKGLAFKGYLGGFFDGEQIYLHDGTHEKTINADGPTPTSGYDQLSVSSGTAYHTVTHFDLDPGTYLVQVHFAFAANASKRRVGIVSYSANSSAQISSLWRASAAPVDGENTFLNICGMVKPNTTTTFYLNAMQNSGSSLNVFASYNYVRLA